MNEQEDARQTSPSVARNREPLLEVLRPRLPAAARVLEVGSGSGEHAVAFAEALPEVTWIPSDPDERARASIAAWTEARGLPNVLAPLDLDVQDPRWPARAREVASGIATGVAGVASEASAESSSASSPEASSPIDWVVSINVIHISPPSTSVGLLQGAAALLQPGGVLFLYGPFKRDGEHTAPSNAEFDRWLKERDPRFGVRDLGELEAEANAQGLELGEVVEMPANNLSVLFRRR